jgi:hypothetical protein
VAITTHKNILTCLQIPQNTRGTRSWRRKVVTRRRRNGTSQQRLKTAEKNLRGNLRGIQELSRKAEFSAVDRTSSRGITVLPWRGAEAQQNPGKVRVPVGGRQAGA